MTTVQPDLFGNTPEPEPTKSAVRLDVEALIHVHGFDKVEAAVGQWKIEHSGPVPSVGARDTDPRTSVGGRMGDVRRFGQQSHSGRLLHRFASAGESGLTDKEATDLVVGDVMGGSVGIARWEGCRRRCSDLRAAGYIDDSGAERDDRIVWVITLAGEKALDRMNMTGWTR